VKVLERAGEIAVSGDGGSNLVASPNLAIATSL
jgi:hypothetical protein